MSVESEAWVVKHSPYKGSRYAVHKAIAEIVNKERGWKFYGRVTELSRKIRVDRTTIGTALAEMVQDGYLAEVRPAMVAINGLLKPTGRPAIYRFVFVKNAPLVYDASGEELASDEGEEITAPPNDVTPGEEPQPCISAGQSLALDHLHAPVREGEEITASPRRGDEISSPRAAIPAPGEEITARGAEIPARNSIELNSNLTRSTDPPNPHDVGAQGRRVDGNNPRAVHDAPRDRGTNRRALDVDWFLERARRDDPEPVLVHEHLDRIHTALGRGLDQTTEGARP